MKNVLKSVCLIVILYTLLNSCQTRNFDNSILENKKEENNFSNSSNDSTGANYYSGSRKLIHNASIAVEVNNCINTTNKIEEKTVQCMGFIMESNFGKNTIKTEESIISTDSVKQINYFENTANLVVRVPDTALQAYLLYIQQLSNVINTRVINAKDVTIDLPNNAQEETVIIENKSNTKINEILKLKDDLNFCTIAINLKEPIAFAIQSIVNTDASWASSTSIWNKIWYNLQKGFVQLFNIITNLLQFWFLIPLLMLAILVYHKSKYVINKFK